MAQLRLTFGLTPDPPKFCLGSEIIFDLWDDIIDCEEWDPSEVNSPHQHRVKIHNSSLTTYPLKKRSRPQWPPSWRRWWIQWWYISSICSTRIWKITHWMNTCNTTSIQPYYVSPLSENEPIHRNDPQFLNNMDAESQLRELKTYLG